MWWAANGILAPSPIPTTDVYKRQVHSHLLWLGLLADALGFESLFMEAWRQREKILDLFDKTTGGRIIFSVNCVGGCLLYTSTRGDAFFTLSDHSLYQRTGIKAPDPVFLVEDKRPWRTVFQILL